MVHDKLLDTAVAQFARVGFEGASTRAIALASGTAMSSITYHFGGKQGLYLAAAEHIARHIRERQAEALATMTAGATSGGTMSRAEAVTRLLGMLDALAEIMLHPDSADWACFIVREQQAPTEAFERLYEGAMGELTEAFVALVGIARPDLPERRARALTMLLFGHALVMRVARACAARMLGVDDLGAAEGRLLRDELRESAACILKGEPQ